MHLGLYLLNLGQRLQILHHGAGRATGLDAQALIAKEGDQVVYVRHGPWTRAREPNVSGGDAQRIHQQKELLLPLQRWVNHRG
jgi:hypothetical protein